MFPVRDLNPVRSVPFATWGLIAVNLGVWLVQVYVSLLGADASQRLVFEHGMVPARVVGLEPDAWLTPITSMFMHGDWLHLLGNMWFLWIFGDNVEDRLGRARYLAFYVVAGLAAAAAQVVIDPLSTVPMVGASGAIAGVLAAYVLLFPRARVLTYIPLFLFAEVPAYLFVFVWFAMQLVFGYASLGVGGGGVAFFAHIGGFVAGLLLVILFHRHRPGPPRSLPPRSLPPRSLPPRSLGTHPGASHTVAPTVVEYRPPRCR